MHVRLVCLAILMGAAAFGQETHGFYPWWDAPITQDIELTAAQKDQVQAIMRSYRPKLSNEHAAIARAEDDLEAIFNAEFVDESRALEGIRELAAARQASILTVSEMSLKLREVLTPAQWKELQRKRAERAKQRNPQSRN